MKTLLKSLGGVILLVGVGVLLVPTLTDKHDNTYLVTGLGLIIGGFLLHIFLNKKFV